jgi:hypothetical protein
MLIERMRKRLAADTKFIEPCLPSPADKPPSGSNWIDEITAASFARDDQTSQGIPRRPILIANQPVQIYSPVNRSSQDAILKGFIRVVCSCGGSDEPAVRFAKMQPCLLGFLKRRN